MWRGEGQVAIEVRVEAGHALYEPGAQSPAYLLARLLQLVSAITIAVPL
jgi:hypothetical protein